MPTEPARREFRLRKQAFAVAAAAIGSAAATAVLMATLFLPANKQLTFEARYVPVLTQMR